MAAVQGVVTMALLLLVKTATSAFDYIADIGNDYAPNENVSESMYDLPAGFMFGSASAAFQIEGAWNLSGKGPSMWDDFLHEHADLYPDNGDVAADSYHNYKTDVLLSKNTLFNTYRFSISWPRLLPDGTTDNINQDGIDYYNNVINELIANNIIPVVTLYHWDLPSALEAKGGWAGGPSIQDDFVEYAKLAFKNFGDRVQWWITFNEPLSFCTENYEYPVPISYSSKGVGSYQCSYNLLMAHAKAYQAYYEDYSLQGGQVGITNVVPNAQPLDPTKQSDRDAADRYMEFQYAWFVDPIFTGDYPPSMRNTIDANSVKEGRNVSRLPVFTDAEKALLKDSTDFLGTNHYTTTYATPSTSCTTEVSYDNDIAVTTTTDPSWRLGTHWSTSTPWGFRRAVNWVSERYNNIPIFITENGYNGNTEEGLNDFNRVSLLSTFIRALLRATNEDKCNVIGYLTWSLIDNLEWQNGYSQRFGIHFVDFNDPARKRTTKKSATFLRGVVRSQRVPYYGYVRTTTTA